jgi:hypothetical protein
VKTITRQGLKSLARTVRPSGEKGKGGLGIIYQGLKSLAIIVRPPGEKGKGGLGIIYVLPGIP